MRVRFWKATALAAGFLTASVFTPVVFGQETKPQAGPATKPEPAAKASTPGRRTVQIQLALATVRGAKRCSVEVKPANATCAFKPQTVEIPPRGEQWVELRDVEIRGADRNLAIALTIHQEGETPKTVYRGYRVAADVRPGAVEKFLCCMSSPSYAAAVGGADPTTIRR